MKISLNPPAKINWFLRVIDKRDDGYHNIVSSLQCISLYDNLTFEQADNINVESDLDLALNDNLVYKAASLLKKFASYPKGAKITLKKNIPICAGLGGGSSDAAFTLLGLNMLWELELHKDVLSSVAEEIGSDVSFFLKGPFSLAEGKGEKITPLKNDSPNVLLLVKPPISISTAWVYEEFDKQKSSELTKSTLDIKLFCQALNRQDFAFLSTMLDNDLEKVITERHPVVRSLKDELKDMGALFSSMSGSGPTVFGVFHTRDLAEKAAKAFESNWCSIVETLI